MSYFVNNTLKRYFDIVETESINEKLVTSIKVIDKRISIRTSEKKVIIRPIKPGILW